MLLVLIPREEVTKSRKTHNDGIGTHANATMMELITHKRARVIDLGANMRVRATDLGLVTVDYGGIQCRCV